MGKFPDPKLRIESSFHFPQVGSSQQGLARYVTLRPAGVNFIKLFVPYAEQFTPYIQLLRSFLLGLICRAETSRPK